MRWPAPGPDADSRHRPEESGPAHAEVGRGPERFSCLERLCAPAQGTEIWAPFVEMMSALSAPDGRAGTISAQVHRVRQFYAPLLERRHDRPQARLRDLEQLEIVAGRFEDRTTFLADLTLDPPTSTQDFPADPTLDEDYLILSTIHSAKGLEWDAVYVLHAADGCIPSDMATSSEAEIEEERRLFYVALDPRAQPALRLLSAAVLFRQPPPRRRIRLRPADTVSSRRRAGPVPGALGDRARRAGAKDHRSCLDPRLLSRGPQAAQADLSIRPPSCRGGSRRFFFFSPEFTIRRLRKANGPVMLVFAGRGKHAQNAL